MNVDITSLAIGAAIGVAVVTIVIVVLVLPEKVGLDNQRTMAAVLANNQTHFFMSGLVIQMSDGIMVLDQTFGRPDFNDNPSVEVRLDWAAFVSCVGTGTPNEECEDSVANRVGKEPVSVCALTRMYNGEFYAGKIWADSGCGSFSVEGTNG